MKTLLAVSGAALLLVGAAGTASAGEYYRHGGYYGYGRPAPAYRYYAPPRAYRPVARYGYNPGYAYGRPYYRRGRGNAVGAFAAGAAVGAILGAATAPAYAAPAPVYAPPRPVYVQPRPSYYYQDDEY